MYFACLTTCRLTTGISLNFGTDLFDSSFLTLAFRCFHTLVEKNKHFCLTKDNHKEIRGEDKVTGIKKNIESLSADGQ